MAPPAKAIHYNSTEETAALTANPLSQLAGLQHASSDTTLEFPSATHRESPNFSTSIEPPSQRASTWSTHSSASAGSAPQSTQPEGHQPANIDLQKWVCSICKCDFQEEKDYVTHISTDEHLQLESNISKHTPASRDSVTHSPQPQARQRANRDQHRWICSVCKCEFQEEKDYIDHLSTQEHLQLESRESVPRSTQPEDCQRVSRDQHKWMCSICQCDFQDEKEYIEHLSSKKHKSKSSKHSSKSRVLMPSATRKWVCSICQREFQHDNDYTTHITSKKNVSFTARFVSYFEMLLHLIMDQKMGFQHCSGKE